jgi:3-phenylpropionate/trans-cinnamate dioxygenase ferredoxin reductase component
VLTGSGAGYDLLPYVWSDQLGTRLQIWGELEPGDELAYISGDEDADEFVVAAGRDGHLVGVVAFGARRDAMRAMRQLRAGASWEPGNGPGEPST